MVINDCKSQCLIGGLQITVYDNNVIERLSRFNSNDRRILLLLIFIDNIFKYISNICLTKISHYWTNVYMVSNYVMYFVLLIYIHTYCYVFTF